MAALLDIPIALRLAVVFAASAFVASLINAAIYHWAWDRRLVSPWQPSAEGVAPRSWLDRLPIVGWLRLRRDAAVLGRGFWVRPLLIELGFAAAMAALYWWEVDRLGLLRPQLAELAFSVRLPPIAPGSLAWPLHLQFAVHSLLATLMTIATFIDFDERIIPDEVTFPGTLAGLLLSAVAPMALLPNVQERPAAPTAGVEIVGQGGAPMIGPQLGRLYLEPTHVGSPNAWPGSLRGGPTVGSLAVGLGCFWLWCFAITDRHWPGRDPNSRRFGAKLRLIARRVLRDLTRSPIREAFAVGTLAIAGVWWLGGAAWVGLLSALVGMAASGGLVWAVRLIGGLVLRREAMGFGDVTLMMMVGTLTGWQAAPIIFFLAPGAGLALALFNLLLRGDQAIPYGPFLCLATAGVVVGWGWVWAWADQLYQFGWLVPAVLVVCFGLLGVLLALLQVLKALLGVAGED